MQTHYPIPKQSIIIGYDICNMIESGVLQRHDDSISSLSPAAATETEKRETSNATRELREGVKYKSAVSCSWIQSTHPLYSSCPEWFVRWLY